MNSCIFDQSSKLSSSSSAIFELDKRNARIRSIYESMGGYRFDFFIELKSSRHDWFVLYFTGVEDSTRASLASPSFCLCRFCYTALLTAMQYV